MEIIVSQKCVVYMDGYMIPYNLTDYLVGEWNNERPSREEFLKSLLLYMYMTGRKKHNQP